MTIALYSVVLNHHQAPIADELYSRIGDDFVFVETSSLVDNKGAEINFSLKPYLLQAWKNEESFSMALRLALEADVCIFGADSQKFAVHRAKNNPNGLSFEYGEHWLKHGFINVFSPRLIKWRWNYMRYYKKSNFYKLCASAFAKRDDEQLGCYKGRHYKWGYFTEVSLEKPIVKTEGSNRSLTLMWCARFIKWKHPELAIECAKRLKMAGYKFQLDMYGDGILRPSIEKNVARAGLSDYVNFYGNVPNCQIKKAMREADIFLFTSDRKEGWGAVANEAMAAGCCLVASDKLGTAPYLIRDKLSGYMFRDRDKESLFNVVKYAIENPVERINVSKQAWNDIVSLWSPQHAAMSLIQLIDDLQNGRDSSISEGPCSKA